MFNPTVNHICNKCFSEIIRAELPVADANSVLEVKSTNLRTVMAPFKYTDGITNSILDLKYGHCDLAAQAFAPFMRELVKVEDYDLIIPIPLSKSRLRERGYNQAYLIAKNVFENHKHKVRQDIVDKAKKTTPQTKMTTSERVANQDGAYTVKKPFAVEGKRVLLVDDVITSGATTSEVATVLMEAGANYIDALSIARVNG